MFYVTNCYTLVHREYMHACCCKKKNNFAIDLFVDNNSRRERIRYQNTYFKHACTYMVEQK